MLTILPSPDHLGAYAISGTLTKEDFDRLIADVDAKLKAHDRIAVMLDLTGFEDITFKAALEDLRYGFGHIRDWTRFKREAVVTDKQWIRTMIHGAGMLLPFIELKTFEPGEQQAAIDWAADIKQPASAS
ncbi:STAS/SEC14 domain-containing protein [Sphingomonas cavernae]|uniref:STAS/SEC14 domain-containing protein n=1 Tax=Sphingomonas cavernae TaxID=2320861 RepID=A0A418WLN5_9SPHN|nr:STAS/SEC14 domain-containing protein [Sphingomonas cavernae]RJF90905.1 STAS/SEC14 domain-containing protein [Sphingomonas cavernae]